MLLELDHIRKEYAAAPGKALTVLNGVNLRVARGEAIAITGPSGSGKSTLLNIIGALDRPTAGSVVFDGMNLAEMSENRLAQLRNTGIGFVFQLHHLLPQCTVLENVLIPTLPAGKNKSGEMKSRAENLLRRVGLENHFEYFPAQLSGGERQRVAVVRALINSPKLLLADEPTGSLDQESADALGSLLLQVKREENLSLIVVTHSPSLARRMDSVYTLRQGVLEKSIRST
jgi:ABC-type lipoprotein export system ATPase subunit